MNLIGRASAGGEKFIRNKRTRDDYRQSEKNFPLIPYGTDSRSDPGDQAIFSWLEEILNDNGFTQVAPRESVSVARVDGSGTSVRNSSEHWQMQEYAQPKLMEVVAGSGEGTERGGDDADGEGNNGTEEDRVSSKPSDPIVLA
jgi:hypothetical protein